MKELHNHIFSNTTCISKETMLKYINHQLSTQELHEVEKHLLDCEFCSDALEGMKYAQNSSMIFAIDNEIDQRVRLGKAKRPVMKNLMVAASILIIVFGTYFTFDYFNTTVENQVGLAMNEDNAEEYDLTTSSVTQKSGEELKNNTSDKDKRGVSGLSYAEPEVVEEDEESTGKYTTSVEQAPPAPMVEEVLEAEEEVVTVDFYDGLVEADNDLSNESQLSDKLYKDEKKKLDERTRNELAAGGAKIEVSANQQAVSTESTNLGFVGNADDSKAAVEKEVNRANKKSESKGKRKNKFKSNANAPSFAQEESLAEVVDKTDLSNDRAQDQTITLSNHKVVDYRDEYQKEYDLKQVVETKSTTADFESKEEAAEAEREIDEITVEITYKATLEKAMAYFNAKKYTLALEQFDIILKEHPEEVNGLFYGGLSNYHLQRYDKAKGELDKVLVNPKTSFNEEAEWYKALTLIELKKSAEAKKLLQKIAAGSGFYKAKAKDKLNAF